MDQYRGSGLTIFQQLPIGRQTLSSHPFITPKPSHCNLLNSRTLPKVHMVWHSACRAYLQKELKLASFLCLQMRQAWKHLETDLFGLFKFSERCCSSWQGLPSCLAMNRWLKRSLPSALASGFVM